MKWPLTQGSLPSALCPASLQVLKKLPGIDRGVLESTKIGKVRPRASMIHDFVIQFSGDRSASG